MPAPDYKATHPKNRKQWRQWLEKNHSSSPVSGLPILKRKPESQELVMKKL